MKYTIVEVRGLLSTRTKEVSGTLEELCKHYSYLLKGKKCRKSETLVRKLNASQNGHEHEFCYTYFSLKG